MIGHRPRALASASLALGLLVPARASAASLTQVSRNDWTGGVNLPSYVQMYIYVPDALATKPPIMVSVHSCGSSADGQMNNIPISQQMADQNGFIMILPDNPGQNCWDVGSSKSLKHDGGGDTQAIAQMVKYTLTKYSGDAARVYVMGGSSGGMMTQALMAVYPDVFRAGSARAGVPAGCWADGYDSSQQWSNNCAGGNTTKTAQQWGDLVRGMYPGYTGHRPRLQIMQGTADSTISYKNTAESIKEWTNVLELSTDPSSSDTGYKAAKYTWDRKFWKNACDYVVFEAWSSPGGTHSMNYEEAETLKFFGLDTATTVDPEPDCNGDGGSGMGGAPGAGGIGGAPGAGGMGGAPGAGGMGGALPAGGSGGAPAGSGGMPASGGGGAGPASSGSGGTGFGGMPAGTGGSVAMGSAGTGGTATMTGSGTGGTGGSSPAASGGPGVGGQAMGKGTSDADQDGNTGVGCTIGEPAPSRKDSAIMALGLGLGLVGLRRRRRRSRR